MPRKRFYAVAKGRETGIFDTWEDCQRQVQGFVGNQFKGFATRPEAEAFLERHGESSVLSPPHKRPYIDPQATTRRVAQARNVVEITDSSPSGSSSYSNATTPNHRQMLPEQPVAVAATVDDDDHDDAAPVASPTSSEVETLAVKTFDEILQEKLAHAQSTGQVIELLSPEKANTDNLTRLTIQSDSKPPTTGIVKTEPGLNGLQLDFGRPEAKQQNQKSELLPKTNDRKVRIMEVFNTNLSIQIKKADKGLNIENHGSHDATTDRQMHGDVPPLCLHQKFFVQGVRVGWPYPAILPPQRQMVNHVIFALRRALHCVLESPTGTGKSAALLCAVLAWQRYHAQRQPALSENEEITDVALSVPKIYYCSRTHSQVAQMVASLKKTPYRPRMAVLGSRERLCIHREIKPRDGTATSSSSRVNVNQECRTRIRNTEKYRKQKLSSYEPGNFYSDEHPPVHVMGDGQARTDAEAAGDERYPKCPHYRQLTAVRTAELVQAELAPSQKLVNCCSSGGDKTPLGAMDIEDLVAFGMNPYMHRSVIYRNDPSESLGVSFRKTDTGDCFVSQVHAGGLAAQEGNLKEGDVLRKVNGRDMQGLGIKQIINTLKSASSPVELEVIRKEGRLVDGRSQGGYSNHAVCPYFLSRGLAAHAEIVFSPYNYLLDPSIRDAMSLDIKNAIVVLDEAHNVEDTLRESGSGTFGEFELCEIILMLEDYCRYRPKQGNGDANIGEICHELLLFVENLVQLMRDSRQRFENNPGKSGADAAILEWEKFKTPDDKEFEESYFGPTGNGVQRQAVGCKAFFDRINRLGFVENETLLHYVMELQNEFGGKDESETPDTENREANLIDRLTELISKLHHAKSNHPHFYISCACRANGSLSYASGGIQERDGRSKPPQKIVLPRKSPPICRRGRCDDAGGVVHCSACNGSTPRWEALLSIQLLTPSILLKPIADQCRSLIFASGSLAPLGSLCAELGLVPASDEAHAIKPMTQNPVETEKQPQDGNRGKLQVKPRPLEADHVIDLDKQLRAISIGYFPDGSPLTTTYRSYSRDGFYGRLGEALASVVEAIPQGGVLIFLPSYSFLKSCLRAWKPSRYGASHEHVWDRFLASKGLVVVEPTGSQAEFEKAKQEYAEGIRQNGKALLLAVYRGKMSEGISFNDDNARGVICVGIPFPNSHDRSIQAKIDYNNEMRNLCGNQQLLPGNEWYSQQAYRAIAQALGRCIRHAGDYGTVILMDSRHCDDGAPVNGVCRAHSNLPQWMRGHVRNLSMHGPRPVLNNANPPVFNGYRGLAEELATFFRTAKVYSQSVLDDFARDFESAKARSVSTEHSFDHKSGTWSQSQAD